MRRRISLHDDHDQAIEARDMAIQEYGPDSVQFFRAEWLVVTDRRSAPPQFNQFDAGAKTMYVVEVSIP